MVASAPQPTGTPLSRRQRQQLVARLSAPMILFLLLISWVGTNLGNTDAPTGTAQGRIMWQPDDFMDLTATEQPDGTWAFPARTETIPGLHAGASVDSQRAALQSFTGRTLLAVQHDGATWQAPHSNQLLELSILRTETTADGAPLATLTSGRWPTGPHEALSTPAGQHRGLPTTGSITVTKRNQDSITVTIVGTGTSTSGGFGSDHLITGVLQQRQPGTAPTEYAAAEWLITDDTPITDAQRTQWEAAGLRLTSKTATGFVGEAQHYGTQLVSALSSLPLILFGAVFAAGFWAFFDTVLPLALLWLALGVMFPVRLPKGMLLAVCRDAVGLAFAVVAVAYPLFLWALPAVFPQYSHVAVRLPLTVWIYAAVVLWLLAVLAGHVAWRTPQQVDHRWGRFFVGCGFVGLGTAALFVGTSSGGLFGLTRLGQVLWLLGGLVLFPWLVQKPRRRVALRPVISPAGVIFTFALGVTVLLPTSATLWFVDQAVGQSQMGAITLASTYRSYPLWVALFAVVAGCWGVHRGGGSLWRHCVVSAVAGVAVGSIPAVALWFLPKETWFYGALTNLSTGAVLSGLAVVLVGLVVMLVCRPVVPNPAPDVVSSSR